MAERRSEVRKYMAQRLRGVEEIRRELLQRRKEFDSALWTAYHRWLDGGKKPRANSSPSGEEVPEVEAPRSRAAAGAPEGRTGTVTGKDA